MRWLITVPAGIDLSALGEALRSANGCLRDLDPVPMGADEVVVFAEGPPDLPHVLDTSGIEVLQVNPESEPTPYGTTMGKRTSRPHQRDDDTTAMPQKSTTTRRDTNTDESSGSVGAE